jgi:DNA-binding MarR family transcriptional regulator
MKDLDPMLHNQLRLSIMSLLVANEEITFTFIVDKTNASRGNVSVQVSKLEETGYLKVNKSFVNKRSQTSMSITDKGLAAMDEYTRALKDYLKL